MRMRYATVASNGSERSRKFTFNAFQTPADCDGGRRVGGGVDAGAIGWRNRIH